MTDVLRVGNCSGFYGDRLSAMREMLDGGALDVLTGDYLAELTMLILGRDTHEGPVAGLRAHLPPAGRGLPRPRAGPRACGWSSTPAASTRPGWPTRLRELAAGLGLAVAVAHVEGDDLRDRVDELGLAGERGKPLTANAYLGAWGIAAALHAGADVVVTGRVTDASLVVGPGGRALRLGPRRLRRAGRRDRGRARARVRHRRPPAATSPCFASPDPRPLGFPLAEIAADGSAVITKHPGTGGAVTVDTVTAQLLYEIAGPDLPRARRRPPVSTRIAPDRRTVRTGCGSPGSAARPRRPRLKVCLNELGGFRNSVEVRADRPRHRGEGRLGPQPARGRAARRPASLEWTLARTDHAGRRHRGGRRRAAAGHRQGPRRRTPSGGRSAAPPWSSRWRRTRASR